MLEYPESNIVNIAMKVDSKMVYPKGVHQKDVFFKAKYTSSDKRKGGPMMGSTSTTGIWEKSRGFGKRMIKVWISI